MNNNLAEENYRKSPKKIKISCADKSTGGKVSEDHGVEKNFSESKISSPKSDGHNHFTLNCEQAREAIRNDPSCVADGDLREECPDSEGTDSPNTPPQCIDTRRVCPGMKTMNLLLRETLSPGNTQACFNEEALYLVTKMASRDSLQWSPSSQQPADLRTDVFTNDNEKTSLINSFILAAIVASYVFPACLLLGKKFKETCGNAYNCVKRKIFIGQETSINNQGEKSDMDGNLTTPPDTVNPQGTQPGEGRETTTTSETEVTTSNPAEVNRSANNTREDLRATTAEEFDIPLPDGGVTTRHLESQSSEESALSSQASLTRAEPRLFAEDLMNQGIILLSGLRTPNSQVPRDDCNRDPSVEEGNLQNSGGQSPSQEGSALSSQASSTPSEPSREDLSCTIRPLSLSKLQPFQGSTPAAQVSSDSSAGPDVNSLAQNVVATAADQAASGSSTPAAAYPNTDRIIALRERLARGRIR